MSRSLLGNTVTFHLIFSSPPCLANSLNGSCVLSLRRPTPTLGRLTEGSHTTSGHDVVDPVTRL